MVDDADTPQRVGGKKASTPPSSIAGGTFPSRTRISDSDSGLERLRTAVLKTGRARPRTEPSEPASEPNFAANEVDLVRNVYWSTSELLTARGMDPMTAGRIALRVTRATLLIGEVGLRQVDTAGALQVSDRQVEHDLALVRELGRDLLDEPSPGLPRIPTPPDRIVIDGEAA